jgi:hypothetical protein
MPPAVSSEAIALVDLPAISTRVGLNSSAFLGALSRELLRQTAGLRHSTYVGYRVMSGPNADVV